MAILKIKDQVESAVNGFMEGWMNGDSRKMYKHCQKTWKKNHKRKLLKDWERPKDYKILSIKQKANALCDVWMNVSWQGKKKKMFMRVISEKKPYKPDIKKGTFGINPTSIR